MLVTVYRPWWYSWLSISFSTSPLSSLTCGNLQDPLPPRVSSSPSFSPTWVVFSTLWLTQCYVVGACALSQRRVVLRIRILQSLLNSWYNFWWYQGHGSVSTSCFLRQSSTSIWPLALPTTWWRKYAAVDHDAAACLVIPWIKQKTTSCQSNPEQQTSVRFESKHKAFFNDCIWKCLRMATISLRPQTHRRGVYVQVLSVDVCQL